MRKPFLLAQPSKKEVAQCVIEMHDGHEYSLNHLNSIFIDFKCKIITEPVKSCAIEFLLVISAVNNFASRLSFHLFVS